ncbi:MAG: hypothetical protein ACQ9MH_08190 [Nitrospinales bacterium]
MFLEVEPNSNVDKSLGLMYKDITSPREVYCIKYLVDGEEKPMQITGWDGDSDKPCPANACHIEESGDGTALLIFGGSGGIRLKDLENESPWDESATDQWGDTHLVYPLDSFIVYKDQI